MKHTEWPRSIYLLRFGYFNASIFSERNHFTQYSVETKTDKYDSNFEKCLLATITYKSKMA